MPVKYFDRIPSYYKGKTLKIDKLSLMKTFLYMQYKNKKLWKFKHNGNVQQMT